MAFVLTLVSRGQVSRGTAFLRPVQPEPFCLALSIASEIPAIVGDSNVAARRRLFVKRLPRL